MEEIRRPEARRNVHSSEDRRFDDESGWQGKMVLNAIGAVITGMVMVIFAVTKFSQGAWIVLILMPVLVLLFFRIHRHYRHLAASLTLEGFDPPPPPQRHRIIIPISGVHQGTMAALQYAQLLSSDITAVHVSIDPMSAERVEQRWETWGEGVRLVVLESPYRLMHEPLLRYIRQLALRAAAERDHHGRRAAVRAQAVVRQPAPHTDRHIPPPRAALHPGRDRD